MLLDVSLQNVVYMEATEANFKKLLQFADLDLHNAATPAAKRAAKPVQSRNGAPEYWHGKRRRWLRKERNDTVKLGYRTLSRKPTDATYDTAHARTKQPKPRKRKSKPRSPTT